MKLIMGRIPIESRRRLQKTTRYKKQCLLNYDKKIEFHVHSGFCKLGFSFENMFSFLGHSEFVAKIRF